MFGIDVSDNNGVIDWTVAASSGVQLAILKASEESRADTQLAANYQGAESAGIACLGLYGFARPDLGSGADQARQFLAAIGSAGGLRPGTRLAVDFEEHVGPGPEIAPDADLYAWALDWASVVWPVQSRRDTRLRPLLYSRRDYLAAHNLAHLGDVFDLWLMTPEAPMPAVPPGWSGIELVQTGARVVGGVAGLVDVDWFGGTAYSWLQKSWGYQPAPVAPVTPPDLDPNADVPAILHHLSDVLATVNADLALARTKFGLVV